jgi:cytoskeletal protein CcmA (bactofilin family)
VFGKSKGKSNRYAVGDIIEPLLEEERFAEGRERLARITEQQQMEGCAVAHSEPPAVPDATSTISSGLAIVGKIVGDGRLAIFGHVTGEIHASTIQIGDGAQVEGDIVADDLTIGGRVKGTIHANRVKLNSTAVVEGDIYHRSLAIEENAQFEGMSRRQENVIEMPSLVPAKLPQAQAVSINVHEQGDGAADGVNASQAMSIDHNGRGNGASDSLNP